MYNHNMNILRVKAFTLIELLIVVAIIGVLSAVIMSSVNNAREKGVMVANKRSAQELAKVFYKEYSDNGSFSNLLAPGYSNGWIPQHYTCDTLPLSGNYVSEYRNICNSIASRLGSSVTSYMMIAGDGSGGAGQKFSIMLKISRNDGAAGTWYCIGSSGRNYTGSLLTNGSGCYYNP